MVRSTVVDINSNKPLLYPYSVTVNKCRTICNTINDPYARICAVGIVKEMDTKVFNLMSRTNERCYISWHENC